MALGTVDRKSARGKRTYGEYCAVARGLDVIGERWTLLIVRDLLLGAKRYKDLLNGLPGIGTNLLSTRLREMERNGIIEHTILPPPVAAPAYRLTEFGEELEDVVCAVGRWGSRLLGERGGDEALTPRAYLVAMRSAFRPERGEALRGSYELRVEDLVFEVIIRDGACRTWERSATEPVATFAMDAQTLDDLLMSGLDPLGALREGRVKAAGEVTLFPRFIKAFAFPDKNGGHAARSRSRRRARAGAPSRHVA